MPSLLIIVFVFQLALHLINTVGAPIINDIVSFPVLLPCAPLQGRLLDKNGNTDFFFFKLLSPYLAMVSLHQILSYRRYFRRLSD